MTEHSEQLAADEAPAEPSTVGTTEVPVEIERSVRYSRLMIVGAVIGAIIAVLVTVSQPVAQDALYSIGQIAGFMLIVGAVIGLTAGVVLGLILKRFARKKRGVGVAIQADVQ